MRIDLAHITPRKQRLKSTPAQELLDEYVNRANRFVPLRSVAFASEDSLLKAFDKPTSRTAGTLILLDSRGETLTTEALAQRVGRLRDGGTQRLTFAVGPADGWSPLARNRNTDKLSLSALTLPHEIALVLLAEQLYRILTILAGHPYHTGHDAGRD